MTYFGGIIAYMLWSLIFEIGQGATLREACRRSALATVIISVIIFLGGLLLA